jgi:hypothetical protein
MGRYENRILAVLRLGEPTEWRPGGLCACGIKSGSAGLDFEYTGSGQAGPDRDCVFVRRRCPSVAGTQCADKPVTGKGCFFSFAAGARRQASR